MMAGLLRATPHLLLCFAVSHVAASTTCGSEVNTGDSWDLAGCTTLSVSSVTAADMPALARALKSTTELEVLDLSQSTIGDEGLTPLADVLRSDAASVKFIDLSYCSIGDAGAASLAEALKSNSKVRMLVLRGPPVNRAAQMALKAVVNIEPSSRPSHFAESRGESSPSSATVDHDEV